MSYISVDTAVAEILKLGKNALLAKVDIDRVSSRNFILGRKLTDYVAVRPQRGRVDFIIIIIGNFLGGKLGQFGGEVEVFGGGSFPCAPFLR